MMPRTPPVPLQNIEDIEKVSAPQSDGIYPPIRDPNVIPQKIMVFLLTVLLYTVSCSTDTGFYAQAVNK
jgi:hypothetical protein